MGIPISKPHLVAIVAWALGASSVRSQESLPACTRPALDTTNWLLSFTKDSTVSFRLPPSYRPRQVDSSTSARSYSFVSVPGNSSVSGVLNLYLDPPSAQPMPPLPVAAWLPKGDTTTRGYDLTYVEDYSACREAIAGLAAQIETGLISGGYSSFRRERAVHVVWWTAFGGALGTLDAHAGDVQSQRELLAIAHSVRFSRGRPHR